MDLTYIMNEATSHIVTSTEILSCSSSSEPVGTSIPNGSKSLIRGYIRYISNIVKYRSKNIFVTHEIN
jgi:hypothetical protein